MSYTEFHTGKLRKVDTGDLTMEQYCEKRCKDLNKSLSSYNDNYAREFVDSSDKFIILEEELYEFIEHEELEDENFFMKLMPNSDGTISFIGQFYNGGTCLSEMLEDAFKELKNKKSG